MNDRRLTGARIPRFVDLDGPEVSARIRGLVQHCRDRYPDAGTPRALQRAARQALAIETLRREGFSEEDRKELAAWLEHVERGPVPYASKIVCVGCWNERNPQKPAPARCTDDCGNVDPEPCGFCGKQTTSGIFPEDARREGRSRMMRDAKDIRERFERLLGGECYALEWMGLNNRRCVLRINPAGPDLDEVLAEFVERCRQTAALPEPADPR